MSDLYTATTDNGYIIAYRVTKDNLPVEYKRLYVLRDPKPEGWFGPWEELCHVNTGYTKNMGSAAIDVCES